ncbi:MAG TPA: hypothetical protein OIM60_07345 [Clostridiaceae bacterium]|jgi:hypothetical protein|nr:hypothetical protein [Clostridiaceae bacterium]
MSLLQDYEMAKRKIGEKKYNAIDVYLQEICPKENWNQYKQELKKIDNLEINEWEIEKKKLQQKYGIVFLDDILYNEDGWGKFEKWYEKYEQNMKNEKKHKIINGYLICKEGTWCEVTKNGEHIFDGNVDENMTFEQIYQEINKEVVFSLNGKEILSYDLLNEFAGERDSTIELLAQENKCDAKDIKITIRKPNLSEKVLNIKFIGIDNWDRPVYKDENGRILKDTNLGIGEIALCTSSNNSFYGEPDTPINEDTKVKIVKEFNKDIIKNKKERAR